MHAFMHCGHLSADAGLPQSGVVHLTSMAQVLERDSV